MGFTLAEEVIVNGGVSVEQVIFLARLNISQ